MGCQHTSTSLPGPIYTRLTFGDGESGTPLVPQDVQADAAVGVDIGVVDLGGEVDLRGLKGVVCGEVDGQEEDAALVWRIGLISWSVNVHNEDADAEVA